MKILAAVMDVVIYKRFKPGIYKRKKRFLVYDPKMVVPKGTGWDTEKKTKAWLEE